MDVEARGGLCGLCEVFLLDLIFSFVAVAADALVTVGPAPPFSSPSAAFFEVTRSHESGSRMYRSDLVA